MRFLLLTALLLSLVGVRWCANLYASCNIDSDCPTNAKCSKGATGPGKCLCKVYYTGASTTCVPTPRALSETCTDNSQCQKYDAKSECKKASSATADTEGLCECKQIYGRDPTGLKCIKLPCYVSSVCNKSLDTEYTYTPNPSNHFCNSSGYCNCGGGYRANSDNSGCEPDKKNLYETCMTDAQCPDHNRNGVKTIGWCSGGKCACKTGYNNTSSANSSCSVDAKLIYQTCQVVDQCPDNTTCTASACKCASGYKSKDSNNDTCVIDAKKVGDPCINDIQCPSHRDPSGTVDIPVTGNCKAGFCVCNPGWLVASSANDSCILQERMIKDNASTTVQCIYSSPTRAYMYINFGKCTCKAGYKAPADFKSCDVDKKNLTDPCSIPEQCPPSRPGGLGMCSTTCVCDSGNTNTNGVCVPDGKYLGDACVSSSQCANKDPNSLCGANMPEFNSVAECFCKFGFDRDGYKCVPAKKQLDQFCVDDSSCAIVNTKCDVDGLCKCKAGYKNSANSDSCVINSKMVYDSCSINEQCPGGGYGKCQSGSCACITGYQASSDKKNCEVIKKTDGESCSVNDQCPPGASCKTTTCTCDSGLIFDGNSSACVRPQVGGHCTTFCTINAQCVGDKCVCNSGFSTSNGACMNKLGSACTSAEQCAYMPHTTCAKDIRGYKTCQCLVGAVQTMGMDGRSYCSGTARLLLSLPLMILLSLMMVL